MQEFNDLGWRVPNSSPFYDCREHPIEQISCRICQERSFFCNIYFISEKQDEHYKKNLHILYKINFFSYPRIFSAKLLPTFQQKVLSNVIREHEIGILLIKVCLKLETLTRWDNDGSYHTIPSGVFVTWQRLIIHSHHLGSGFRLLFVKHILAHVSINRNHVDAHKVTWQSRDGLERGRPRYQPMNGQSGATANNQKRPTPI
jgi:hypothetical protein